MTRSATPRYPWGTETPGPRLRAACARAQTGLDDAKETGFVEIVQRGSAAVQGSKSLVETMEFLARAGLRVRGTDLSPVQGHAVSEATQAVRDAVAGVAGSSLLTVQARYEAYVAAVETLMALAERGGEHGIAGSGESDPDDPWNAFPT